jgi:LEA14-like dessication related protein
MKILRDTLLITLAAWLSACAPFQAIAQKQLEALQQPRVAVKRVKLAPSRLTEQKFLVDLAIENPNDQGVSANEIALALAINGKDIARGINTHPVNIEAHGTSQVQVAVVANTLELLQQGLSLSQSQQKTVPYEINGHIGLLGGLLQGLKLPVRYSGQIDANELLKRF